MSTHEWSSPSPPKSWSESYNKFHYTFPITNNMINYNLCIIKVIFLLSNQRNDISIITVYDLNKKKNNIWFVVALLEYRIAIFVIFLARKSDTESFFFFFFFLESLLILKCIIASIQEACYILILWLNCLEIHLHWVHRFWRCESIFNDNNHTRFYNFVR